MNGPAVIILGAGRPYRGHRPSALIETGGRRRILDWTMDAFRQLGKPRFQFIGGYRIDDIVRQYPDIAFAVNPRWRDTGTLTSLLLAQPPEQGAAYVCYADTVFRAASVSRLADTAGDVVIAVDGSWQTRYAGRSQGDLLAAEKVSLDGDQVRAVNTHMPGGQAAGEFVGLMKLSGSALSVLKDLRSGDRTRRPGDSIPALLNHFRAQGLSIRAIDVAGQWAELNAPQDLARFVFGTKAETLERLRPLVKQSLIGEQVRFTVRDWRSCADIQLDRIQQTFGSVMLVVRSSALSEDGWSSSGAGNFGSELGVPASDRQQLAAAIGSVIGSYGDSEESHQVLIQQMLTDVVASGVVFTRSLDYGAPYYVLNYDDVTASTESVTSGRGKHLRTLFVHRNQPDAAAALDPRAARALAAVRELEELVDHDLLDVEFALDRGDQLHLFQLRPIAVDHAFHEVSDQDITAALRTATQLYKANDRAKPFVFGERACYGVMPDWNPAEIIGTKPRTLAFSLYRHLVTDETWAVQRAEYGYRDVRPQPLIVSFAGHPYIDIRASFNSFVPAELPDETAAQLVNHYLDRLRQQPQLHDKVEFDIAFTCLSFDFEEQAEARLRPAGFSRSQVDSLREALRRITRDGAQRVARDIGVIESLHTRLARILAADLAPLERAYLLIEDCKRFGILPFAHVARAGFVAATLLRSAVTIGLVDASEREAFFSTLHTVTRRFESDGAKVAAGLLEWSGFVQRYGHLRPGTYEITAETYADQPEKYLRPSTRRSASKSESPADAVWSPASRAHLEGSLPAVGLAADVAAFEDFLRAAIEGREYLKFVFSKALSQALDALKEFGADLGLDADEVSYVSVEDYFRVHKGLVPRDQRAWLSRLAEDGRRWHSLTQAVELPPLIFDQADLFAFERPPTQPNFVSRLHVIADTAVLGDGRQGDKLAGKIVLIPQADPGYDWLFGHGIAGLVTMYGGANSHMAIRAAELNLAAAIGVGEQAYSGLCRARIIDLDCNAKKVRVVR